MKRPGRLAKPTSRGPSRLRARERSLDLLSDLRRGDTTYSALLRKHHLDTRTAHKYLGRNLIGGANGKSVRASKSDRLVRPLFFPDSIGDLPARIRGSKAATRLSEFYRDRAKLLGGELSPSDFEAKWRGVHIAGKQVFADVTEIFRMQSADALGIESLYASTGGER